MAVLVIAEVRDGVLDPDATARTVSAAAGLGDVDVLVAGRDTGAAAAEVARIRGVSRVLTAADPALAHGLAEPLAGLIVSLAGGYGHVLAPATSSGKNVMPRVAALLDVMVISDIVRVIDQRTFRRPIYAGNALQTVRSADPVVVGTVRASGFAPADRTGAAPVQAVAVPADAGLSTYIRDDKAASDRPELTSARIVVSGGRGLGSPEAFALVERLADKLGAAVGASRAAVDSGYAPNDWQVGQTGKIVAPDLYIAVGISGAIQHLAGMKDSKVIVAINKDEEAPIFQVADYGLVADLFTAVPELVEKL
jgi:electron transfer flavoprotein alpha subunit